METEAALIEPRIREPGAVAVAMAGMIALAVGMGFGRFAFTPILPMMQQDAGLSVAEGGWLAAANYLGYLVGALCAIRLRLPPTAAIRSGLAGIGLVTLGMGFARHVDAWLLLRALAGFASAWVLVFGSSWALARLEMMDRSRLSGVVFSGVGVGIAVAGGLCLALMRWHAGSAQAWQASGGLALIGTAAIWARLRGGASADVERVKRNESLPLAWDRDVVRLVLCYGTFGFGYIIPATFVPAMARRLVSDPLLFGSSWPAFGLAAATSTLLAAAATRRLGSRRVWAIAQSIMALGVVAPVVWPTMAGIMVAALLVGGTFMVSTMAGMQEARLVAGPGATSLMAVMTAAFATGQIIGPLVVSYAVGRSGSFSGPLCLASLLLLASGLALFRPRPEATRGVTR